MNYACRTLYIFLKTNTNFKVNREEEWRRTDGGAEGVGGGRIWGIGVDWGMGVKHIK